MLDGLTIRGGNIDEFDADADATEAVAHFGAGVDFISGAGQPETDLENGTFRKMTSGLDEHSAGAEIGRAKGDFLGEAFIANAQFAEMGVVAFLLPR